MALRIEIDIFSGRPNPVIELKGNEARQALERLRPVRRLERGEPGLPQLPTLGYRGLIVDQTETKTRGLPRAFRFAHGDSFGPRLLHRAEDEDFEEFVLRRAGLAKLRRQMPEAVRAEIRRFRATREKWPLRKFPWPTKARCACAPLYEPGWWNVPARQPFNNCYNYATNYRTDTFAQPGQAAGAMYTALTCASVRPAAVADELIATPAGQQSMPEGGAPRRARHLAERRLPLVSKGTQRLLVAQARRHGGDQSRQQRRHHPGSAHGRSRRLHGLLHVHGRHAWPHQNRVRTQRVRGSGSPTCFQGDPTRPGMSRLRASRNCRRCGRRSNHGRETSREVLRSGIEDARLHGPDRAELFAFGGVATMKGAGVIGTQTRKDSRRHLERAILATAPSALSQPAFSSDWNDSSHDHPLKDVRRSDRTRVSSTSGSGYRSTRSPSRATSRRDRRSRTARSTGSDPGSC